MYICIYVYLISMPGNGAAPSERQHASEEAAEAEALGGATCLTLMLSYYYI